jgi:predicted nucleotidyltransferase
MPSRTLTVRGVPDPTLRRLRARAEANHRSLNGELLAVLDAASRDPDVASPGAAVREPAVAVYNAKAKRAATGALAVNSTALREVCRAHHIVRLAVFGSSIHGNLRPDSDVDVIVDFAPGKTPGLGIVRVAEALRSAFGDRRVDLFTFRGLSPRMRDAVLPSARDLYVAP